MLRTLKVTGDSMSPEFKEGDFVVIFKVPFLFQFLKPGNVIVFQHGHYGTLIKRIRSVDKPAREVFVEGNDETSLDSRRLGPIRARAVQGKVIAHFPRPKP